MSRREGRSRLLAPWILLALVASTGCWEQIDDGKWFPQMKRQIAVQAFEDVTYLDHGQGFTPPEGTVPVTYGDVPDLTALSLAEQDALQNPVARTLASMNRGSELFDRYCATCHGPEGLGDGPIAGAGIGVSGRGPLGMVLPIGGDASLARVFSDGHIYTTISLGRGRMPSYGRITPEDRWNLVNYIRELNGQGGSQ
jgi:mono/diheme cytochrome c family protein